MTEDKKTKTVETTVSLGSPLAVLCYLALGLLLYLLFEMDSAAAFTWADPWLWVYMALWPFCAFFWVIAFVLTIVIFCWGVILSIGIGEWFGERIKSLRK